MYSIIDYTYDRKTELTRALLRFIAPLHICAGVAELVDAPDLGSGIFGCGGSSPLTRTNRTFCVSKIFDPVD